MTAIAMNKVEMVFMGFFRETNDFSIRLKTKKIIVISFSEKRL